jgi:hypothetical protein
MLLALLGFSLALSLQGISQLNLLCCNHLHADIFPFNSTVLDSNATLAELQEIVSIGGNMVTVNFELVQETCSGNNISTGHDTPSLESLGNFIDKAHQLGLVVFMKPVLVCDGGIMGINPTDVAGWFVAYEAVILSYASFFEQHRVELFSIALELIHLSAVPENLPYWTSLISKSAHAVRTLCLRNQSAMSTVAKSHTAPSSIPLKRSMSCSGRILTLSRWIPMSRS